MINDKHQLKHVSMSGHDPTKPVARTPQAFHTRLRLARLKAKLTQARLANLVGTTPQAVSTWELGESMPSPDHLLALPNCIGCDPLWLFYGIQLPSIPSRGTVPAVKQPHGGVTRVPHVDALSAAGDPSRAIANATSQIDIPGPVSPGSFAITVWDDSNRHPGHGFSLDMGDNIVIDPSRVIQVGDIVFASKTTDGRIVPILGRYHRVRGGHHIVPLNPAVSAIAINNNDRIIGAAVSHTKRLV